MVENLISDSSCSRNLTLPSFTDTWLVRLQFRLKGIITTAILHGTSRARKSARSLLTTERFYRELPCTDKTKAN